MNDHASPEVAAVETVGGVLTDLVEVAERLPVPPGQAGATARILDRLSEEIAEAAAMLRGAAPSARRCAACRVTGQPLAVIRSRGIGEQDWRELWRCADVTACHDRIFPELAGPLAASRPARIDGSIPAGDPRVNAARVLLAGHREPLTMTPGDLRTLLARYQRALAGLLDLIDGSRS
jgi:hypothetical protein